MKTVLLVGITRAFIMLAALIASSAHAQTPNHLEVFDAGVAVWDCFYDKYEKTDDGKVDFQLLAKILAARCGDEINRHEFASRGQPQQISQAWYDRALEQWRLQFMGKILEERKLKE